MNTDKTAEWVGAMIRTRSGETVEFPLRIKVRPLLVPATMGFGPSSIFIYVAPDATREDAAVSLWHELVHVLKFAGGHQEHDEEEVEALAQRLASACPEVLALCGIESDFPIRVPPCPSVAKTSPSVIDNPPALVSKPQPPGNNQS
jgi:hypothetical protein